MKKRIVELRNRLNLTQTEFGEKIGLSRNAIAAYECGNANPTGTAIIAIVTVFHVNRKWLENGEGEMFEPAASHSDAQRIAETISASPAVQSLLAAWEQLDENGRAVFEDYVRAFVADYRQREADRTTAAYQRILDDAESHSEASPSDAFNLAE